MNLDLLGVFGAGALTFLTPCVLPLVPIYLSALVGGDFRQLQGGQARGQLLLRAAWFSLGFVLVFTLLGLTASSLGAFLASHKAVVQGFGAALIGLFALKFLGVIQIPWLDRTVRPDARKLQTRVGWLNALVMGLVFAAGWSPCIGPVLGAVLTYTASATASPWAGALYLMVYGLGFALPLLAVALFAEAGARWLERLGAHLRKVEVALGALLLVVAGSMALDLMPDFGTSPAGSTTPSAPVVAPAPPLEPLMTAFVSEDCSVCQRMKPVIAGLVQQCDGNKVRLRVVDVSRPEHRPEVSARRLLGVPTFVYETADGQEVARLVGEQSDAALRQALSALRGEPCPGLTPLPGAATPIDLVAPGATLAPAPVACKTGLEAEAPAATSAEPAPFAPAADPACGG
jgi:cytochrome c-type biogenesis protein